MNIIVFSKNRPMQLQAYLESLFYYTQFNQNDVIVIFPYTDDYKKLMDAYPAISWIDELQHVNFGQTLINVVNSLPDDGLSILGVDDFVWFRNVNLTDVSVLSKHVDTVGFHLRLGRNIAGFNFKWNIFRSSNLFKYDWYGKPNDFGYPFEVSQSCYRNSLIKEIVFAHKSKIRIPNDFEAYGVTYVTNHKYKELPFIMMYNDNSCGACVDINRTQDLYQNRIQGTPYHSVDSLLKLYRNGHRINWQSYHNMQPKEPFIGTQNLVICK